MRLATTRSIQDVLVQVDSTSIVSGRANDARDEYNTVHPRGALGYAGRCSGRLLSGGGSSLVHAVKAIDKNIQTAPKTNRIAATWADEKIGIEIVKKALGEPMR